MLFTSCPHPPLEFPSLCFGGKQTGGGREKNTERSGRVGPNGPRVQLRFRVTSSGVTRIKGLTFNNGAREIFSRNSPRPRLPLPSLSLPRFQAHRQMLPPHRFHPKRVLLQAHTQMLPPDRFHRKQVLPGLEPGLQGSKPWVLTNYTIEPPCAHCICTRNMYISLKIV